MTKEIPPEVLAAKIIVSGIHLDLTKALKEGAQTRAARLLRHNDHIVRIRIDIDHDKTKGDGHLFIAKGQIEVRGPDLIASVTSEDAYKSLDLLVDKLDRLLRRKHREMKDKRNHPHDVELDANLPKT
ncbi:MAG: ribosome-associated translation inhibitor RaiA [Cephaloticoccus sp.]|nr:ribosome-associated translation inhibitor RaiA [Cephaloticoccus sp.]MCF7761238.1 ribosome-associated translation inhibitor RaiA [Cephaloticoccus sp.]